MGTFSVLLGKNGIVVVIGWILLAVAAIIVAVVVWWTKFRRPPYGEMEIVEAELGIGQQKVKIKPNYEDVQIAYKLWVEVSTRKIGLPINLEHDVIAEVYNSWYEFFGVTRELIKDIPAQKLRNSRSTEQVVHVAMEVLNEGIRPHLTSWQARFRRWYDRALNVTDLAELAPQDLQKRYPQYEELVQDLGAVNLKLIEYRTLLRKIALGPARPPLQ